MTSPKKRSASKARDAHGGAVPIAATRDFAKAEQDPVHVAQRRGQVKSGSMGKTLTKAKR